MEALSDGELMWFARMGLVLMSRTEASADTVFLFDEPDVHFNDEWNMRVMSALRRLSVKGGARLSHEFMIATHSTLMMTDAYYEQIHLFEREEEAPKALSGGERGRVCQTENQAYARGEPEQQRAGGCDSGDGAGLRQISAAGALL